MRRAAKIDGNQPEIVSHLLRAGWRLFSAAPVGRGIPDLVVACGGFTAVVEVKQAREKLNMDQEDFRAKWPGVYIVGRTPEQTLKDLERARAEVMG